MPCEKARGGGGKAEARYGVMTVAMAVVILVMTERADESNDDLGGTEFVGWDADSLDPGNPTADERAVVIVGGRVLV